MQITLSRRESPFNRRVVTNFTSSLLFTVASGVAAAPADGDDDKRLIAGISTKTQKKNFKRLFLFSYILFNISNIIVVGLRWLRQRG